MKKIVSLICLFFCLLMAVSALAENNEVTDSNVTYRGGAEHFVVLPENKDLFQNFKRMMPGETREQTIILTNEFIRPLRFYLRAEEAPNETVGGVRLIDILDFALSLGEEKLYQGTLNDSVSGMSTDILLGSVDPGQSVSLTASLYAPGEKMGNEYMRLEAAVNWIFTVEDYVTAGEIRNVGDCFD